MPRHGERTGAALMLDCLEQEDVEYVFGLPGEQTVPIMDAFQETDIEFVVTRHEQGAAFMADVYGRLTGDAGVCLSTLGPGATNLLTGVADAQLDGAPVVALTSQRNQDELHKRSHQYIDVTDVFHEVTKWNETVRAPETIPEIVRKAFSVAKSEKPGATHIELPEDVTTDTVAAEPLTREEPSQSGSRPKDIDHVIDLLQAAENPIILAGNEVIRAGGAEELTAFAEETGIPVVTTFMGKGAISARHDLSVGTIGFQEEDYSLCGLEQSDTVLVVGMDYIEYHPKNWNREQDKDIIYLGSNPPEIDAYYQTKQVITGNVARLLEQLGEKAQNVRKDDIGTDDLRAFVTSEVKDHKEDESFPMKPQRIVHELREALDDDDVLLSDVGAHKYWLSRLYPAYEPNTFIVSNGFASMGIALPGAIAADLATDDQDVLAATGDGGFLMNVQELETADRLGIDMTIVVFNDEEYAAITWEQMERYGETFGASFTNPDIAAMAESFGATGHRVEDASELEAVLADAVTNDGVDVVDVPVDPAENMRLTEELGDIVCPV